MRSCAHYLFQKQIIERNRRDLSLLPLRQGVAEQLPSWRALAQRHRLYGLSLAACANDAWQRSRELECASEPRERRKARLFNSQNVEDERPAALHELPQRDQTS